MTLAVRTKHVLEHAGRIGHGVKYCIEHPEDCPRITRMLAIHVFFSPNEWARLRNSGQKNWYDLCNEERPDIPIERLHDNRCPAFAGPEAEYRGPVRKDIEKCNCAMSVFIKD